MFASIASIRVIILVVSLFAALGRPGDATQFLAHSYLVISDFFSFQFAGVFRPF